jgi:prepilin-type processing-associated H-X9-DG protein
MPDTRSFPTPPAISGNYFDWYDLSIAGLDPPLRSHKLGRPTEVILLGDACLRSGSPSLNQPGPVFRINSNVWTGSTQAAFTPIKKFSGNDTDNNHPIPIGPNVDRLDSTGTTDNIRWRHGRSTTGSVAANLKASSANFLFGDGHVENLSPDFVLMRNVRVGK